MITTTRTSESTAPTGGLLLAFELGQRSWKLGFTVGIGQRPRIRQMPAGAVSALVAEIARAKQRFGLAAEAPVTSCYEAGLLVASIPGGARHHELRRRFLEHRS
jgi:transposase